MSEICNDKMVNDKLEIRLINCSAKAIHHHHKTFEISFWAHFRPLLAQKPQNKIFRKVVQINFKPIYYCNCIQNENCNHQFFRNLKFHFGPLLARKPQQQQQQQQQQKKGFFTRKSFSSTAGLMLL